MPSNHLILCCPLLLPHSIFPSIRVFSNESVLLIRWPKYWSFSFSISPFNEYSDWFPLGCTGWISLLSEGLSKVFSNTTVQKHQFFGAQLSLVQLLHPYMTTGRTTPLTRWTFVGKVVSQDLSLPLGLALGSPIFPSGCDGKLGVALESLQGLRDLT